MARPVIGSWTLRVRSPQSLHLTLLRLCPCAYRHFLSHTTIQCLLSSNLLDKEIVKTGELCLGGLGPGPGFACALGLGVQVSARLLLAGSRELGVHALRR